MRDQLYRDVMNYRKVKSKLLKQRFGQKGGSLFPPNTRDRSEPENVDMDMDTFFQTTTGNDDTNKIVPFRINPVEIFPDKPDKKEDINPSGKTYLNPVSYIPKNIDRSLPKTKKNRNLLVEPLKTPSYRGPSNPYATQSQILDEMLESSAGDLGSEIASLLLGLL